MSFGIVPPNPWLCIPMESAVIPIETGHHPFRLKPAGDSDEVGQGGGSDRKPVNGVSCDGFVKLAFFCGGAPSST
jgi:hypothetical protein